MTVRRVRCVGRERLSGRPGENGGDSVRQRPLQQGKARKGRGSSAQLGEGKNLWITQRFPLTPRRISYIMLTTKCVWNNLPHCLEDRAVDKSSRPPSLAEAHPSAIETTKKKLICELLT